MIYWQFRNHALVVLIDYFMQTVHGLPSVSVISLFDQYFITFLSTAQAYKFRTMFLSDHLTGNFGWCSQSPPWSAESVGPVLQ